MRVVIIGAGPAGLKLAVELKEKKHVTELAIYDDRAGVYTRPGVLNSNVFTQAGLQVSSDAFRDNRLHIKDFERILYAKAQALGIPIIKHKFISLYQDAKKPGICIDVDGKIVQIAADFVFDCTGRARQVVNAVNRLIPDSPMQLKKITDVPVPNHFIAYVKMDNEDRVALQEITESYVNGENVSSMRYTQSLIKLRALGWKHFTFPHCVVHPFEGEKVCLYMYAPDNLAKENYDAWVETVLEAYAPGVRYQKMPPAPPALNKPPKPRFGLFNLGGCVLEKSAFQGKDLPMVVAKGDAEIDFNYLLGHGILDGLERIDALLDSIDVEDGAITDFYIDRHHEQLQTNLTIHIRELNERAEEDKQQFQAAKSLVKDRLSEALVLDTYHSRFTLQEKETIFRLLAELSDYSPLAEFDLHVDLITSYSRLKKYDDVVSYGRKALTVYRTLTEDVVIMQILIVKIISILTTTLCEQVKRVLPIDPKRAEDCYAQALGFFQSFKADLDEDDQHLIEETLERAKPSFTTMP